MFYVKTAIDSPENQLFFQFQTSTRGDANTYGAQQWIAPLKNTIIYYLAKGNTEWEERTAPVSTVDNSKGNILIEDTSVNNIYFEVNDNFYDAKSSTTWVVYDKKEGGVAVDTINIDGLGEAKFSVTGNYVTMTETKDVDTTYSVWVEDKICIYTRVIKQMQVYLRTQVRMA